MRLLSVSSKSIFLLTILGLISMQGWAQGDGAGEQHEFRVFDATQYKGKPDLSEYGIQPLPVIYGHFLWPEQKVKQALPEDKFLKGKLGSLISGNEEYICLDIEHWPTKGTDEVIDRSINKFKKVFDVAKAINPDALIGYYGEVPPRDYIASAGPRSGERWKALTRRNARLRELASHVDVLFPSLYTFYKKPDEWVKYAENQLSLAKLHNRPVYAFLWPQYHDSNRWLGLEYIDGDFWRLQLETVARYADGVVIWGGWNFDKRRPAVWNEKAQWWQETKSFLTELNKSCPLKRRQRNKAGPESRDWAR